MIRTKFYISKMSQSIFRWCIYIVVHPLLTKHKGGGNVAMHDDVIKWKHFPRNWPFVRRIHRSPVNSPHKGQWRGALMFSLICVWINGWVNNREAGDLRRYRANYDVTVINPNGFQMYIFKLILQNNNLGTCCEIALRWKVTFMRWFR